MIGAVLAAVLGVMAAFMMTMDTFLLTAIALSVLAFLPLIIKAFTSRKIPRPTLYGTSSPNEMTTVAADESSSAGEENGSSSLAVVAITAGIGLSLFAVFLISTMVYII